MTALGILGAYGWLVCFIKPVIDFKLVESENTAFLRRLVSLVGKSLRPVCAKLSHCSGQVQNTLVRDYVQWHKVA